MTAEDFVDVKLSAVGEALAGATPALAPGETFAGESAAPCVRIAGGNYEYCFEPGKTQRLPGAEFRSRLEQTVIQGQAIFEIVPAANREIGVPGGRTRPIETASERS